MTLYKCWARDKCEEKCNHKNPHEPTDGVKANIPQNPNEPFECSYAFICWRTAYYTFCKKEGEDGTSKR